MLEIMAIDYSTADVDAPRRFDYWNDVVCRHCIPAASNQLTDEAFNGQLSVQSVGVVDISAMSAPLHCWSRGPQHMRMRDDDDLWIGYMRAGQGAVVQGERHAELHDGDMALYDSARPFQFTLAPQSIYLVRFPRRSLLQRYPDAERMTARTLNMAKPAATQLRSMIEQAATINFEQLRPGAAQQFGSTLLDLMGLALEFQGDDSPEQPAERDLHSRVTAYIERNFLDPNLCLQTLADAHHVSTRTITRAFARHQKTPMNIVWQLRLQASHRALVEGRARNVTEAAFDHGFSDVSHFCQAFRKAFGCTPSTLLLDR